MVGNGTSIFLRICFSPVGFYRESMTSSSSSFFFLRGLNQMEGKRVSRCQWKVGR